MFKIQDVLSSKIVFFISLLLFRISLDFCYIVFVNKYYAGTGFGFDFSTTNYVFSWFLYLICFLMTNYRIKNVSDYFFITALLNIIAPLTSLYGLNSTSVYPLLISAVSLFFIYCIVNTKSIKLSSFPYIKRGENIAVVVSTALVFFLVIWYFLSGAATNLNFDFYKVYKYRSENAMLANIGILAYLNNWVIQVFNVFLLCWFLHKRTFYLFILFFAIQTFFYGVSSHKSVLFFPFLITGIWFYFRKSNLSIILPIMFSVLIIASYISFLLSGDLMLPSMFIRRVFFVPAQLTTAYFDYFTQHPHIIWSNSILSNFINYPYDLPVGRVIGNYQGSGASANNGFISSGFAHAGLLGVLIYSILLGCILKFINWITTSGIPLWFAIAVTIVPLRSLLISSDLLTVMLTHGLLVSLFLLILIRKKPENNIKNTIKVIGALNNSPV